MRQGWGGGDVSHEQRNRQHKLSHGQVIQKKVTPVRGRALITHVLKETYDFKGWFADNLNLHVAGLTPNPQGKELHVNHCWRQVRRMDLPAYEKHDASAWVPVECAEPHLWDGRDSVLLLKEWASSNRLSQSPAVVMPFASLGKLPYQLPLPIVPRVRLSTRAITEFLKTAVAVEAKPWFLTKAADWLRHWVAANQEEGMPVSTVKDRAFKFVLALGDYRVEGHEVDPLGWEQWAPRESLPPRVVTVHTDVGVYQIEMIQVISLFYHSLIYVSSYLFDCFLR